MELAIKKSEWILGIWQLNWHSNPIDSNIVLIILNYNIGKFLYFVLHVVLKFMDTYLNIFKEFFYRDNFFT